MPDPVHRQRRGWRRLRHHSHPSSLIGPHDEDNRWQNGRRLLLCRRQSGDAATSAQAILGTEAEASIGPSGPLKSGAKVTRVREPDGVSIRRP